VRSFAGAPPPRPAQPTPPPPPCRAKVPSQAALMGWW
jgi:hypothetical protein